MQNRHTLQVLLYLAAAVYFLGFYMPQKIAAIPENILSPEEIAANQATLRSTTPADAAIAVKASGEETPQDDFLSEEGSLTTTPTDLPLARYLGEKIHYNFEIEEGLRPEVEFWIKVFSHYGRGQIIVHNRDNVGIVYSVLDFSSLYEQGLPGPVIESLKKESLIEERHRISRMLAKLAQHRDSDAISQEEERVLALFERAGLRNRLKNSAAKDKIRFQQGIREKFSRGVEISGLYMKHMEDIFTLEGVPVELTRLPFVESTFDVNAVSPLGAGGLWQFMPETGRQYLAIDNVVDERRDPIMATYAAARHFKHDFAMLENWPMTVNAYNTGAGRLLEARDILKTESMSTIIHNYEHPTYQFDSRNFYPEFLAALYCYEHRSQLFADVVPYAPIKYDLFLAQGDISVPQLSEEADIPLEQVAELNPALNQDIIHGRKALPSGATLKVPYQTSARFLLAAAQVKGSRTHQEWYMVQSDHEGIDQIAARTGLATDELLEANGLFRESELYKGQVLKIPQRTGVAMNQSPVLQMKLK